MYTTLEMFRLLAREPVAGLAVWVRNESILLVELLDAPLPRPRPRPLEPEAAAAVDRDPRPPRLPLPPRVVVVVVPPAVVESGANTEAELAFGLTSRSSSLSWALGLGWSFAGGPFWLRESNICKIR